MEAGHSHTHSHFGDLTRQAVSRIALALGLTLAFVIVEAIAGLWANSLALLSDAGHNLTDVIALGLSWYAIRLSTQPANADKTFGYHRAGILVALVNSTTLVLGALRDSYG
jgi:cobalt-zinc-cadmium efflux system protein